MAKTIYSIKTPDGNPVRAEEAWKDANGGLLTAKATKVSSTTTDTIFVNDGTGNLKDSGKSIKDIVNTYVCGGIEFSGTASAGTLVGDFEGLTQAQLMKRWPFSALYIDDVDSYSSDGTAYGHKDRYLVMPNMWHKETHEDNGSSTFMIASYQVDADYEMFYPGGFTELCIAVYFASTSSESYSDPLSSVSGATPVTGLTQTTTLVKAPYYKVMNGTTFRRAEYLDYRVLACYRTLATIWASCRNVQFVQGYSGVTGYTGSKWNLEDITDVASRLTGVTEQATSKGYMPAGEVASGEILGTSTTEWLGWQKRPFKLLGVENPYGFLHQPVYGLCHATYGTEVYAVNTSHDPAVDITVPGSDFYKISCSVKQVDGWQKTFISVNGFTFPNGVGASDTISVGDYVWNSENSSGWNMFTVGGGFSRQTASGLFAIDFHRRFDYVSPDNGVRLTYER